MLSKKLDIFLHDIVEEAEKTEKLLREKDEVIQAIVSKCEKGLKMHPNDIYKVLQEIIENYKEAI